MPDIAAHGEAPWDAGGQPWRLLVHASEGHKHHGDALHVPAVEECLR